MSRAPLIAGYHAEHPLLWSEGRAISQGRFLAAALALAAALPEEASHVLPLAAHRGLFLLSFCAALLRGRPCLLPAIGSAAAIETLRAAYPDAVVCSDDPAACTRRGDVLLVPARLDDVADPPAAAPEIPLAQLAAIVFTSGSTGAPQPLAKSWGMLIATAERATERFGSRVHIAATVPPQHMYGLETTVMMALVAGCVIDAAQPFYAEDIRARLAALPAPRMLVTTPVHLRALVAANPKLPPLALMLSATAALPLPLALAAEQAFGAPLFEIYGCTEAGSVATRRVTRDAAWRLYRGLSLRTDEDAAWLSADYLGELKLADAIEPLDAERFHLLGRSGDLVKVAGKRLDLAELTEALLAVPGVEDAAVLMPEHAAVNARPAALVVAPGIGESVILAALAKRFDAVFLPRPLKKVDALPRSAVGKLPRAALLQLLGARHG